MGGHWLLTFLIIVACALGLVAGFYWGGPVLLKWLIRRRLGGYIRQANQVDAGLPLRLSTERTVAVLGAGVAGLSAAVTLARRGQKVTIFEKNSYLGGKLGSWQVDLGGETQAWVSHGFHAFFPHYHNLNRWLDSMALRSEFASIGDYVILGRDGQVLRFADLQTTPVLNLFSLMKAGMFTLGDALKAPGRDLYGVFLEYDAEETFRQLDHLSYAEFSDKAQVPPRLKLAFNTFARAFFADETKLSFAELVKSFHFYYLSHDGGLVYDYPRRDYEAAFLEPIRQELERHGAELRMSTPVDTLAAVGPGFLVNGEAFDRVVVATDVVGANHILSKAQGLAPELCAQLSELHPGQRYCVLRLWMDRDVRDDIPVFVITERVQVLDSVTLYHRFEQETQSDVKAAQARGENVRAVIELHCYSVPDDLPDDQVKVALVAELMEFFPELKGAVTFHEHFQLRRDFTAFHVGCDAKRPSVETGTPGLVCAGDWVRLPFPAMLLEAACASGLWAANALLREDGLREEQVLSVPLRGLMAGMPAPPARKILAPLEKPQPLREKTQPSEMPQRLREKPQRKV